MNLIQKISLLAVLLTSISHLQAQVGINILNPDTSAILHLESTDRGLLPPRMTTQQRDNIFSPKPGLTIFNTEDSTLQYFTGDCWLPTWQEDCDACIFDFDISRQSGNIDRIIGNSDSTKVYINQTNGNSSVGVYVVATLPQGISVSVDSAILNGNDSTWLRVTADVFAPAGTYPIVIQAACDGTIKSQVFVITIDPCIEVDIITPQTNYDLQAANNLPTSVPICVVVRIPPGLEMTNDTTAPVFTSGNLHPQSKVGIFNQGLLLARGGDGGVGAGTQGQTGEGEDGTDALVLTTHTHLINTGRIYSGGGGGGSVGFIATIPIPQPVGNFNLGIGAGGGGGSSAGKGGNLSGGLGYYDPGVDATTGILGQGGRGGILVTPIRFQVTVAQFTITPSVFGGNGGEYGQDGQSGTLSFNLDVTINIPFVGNTSIFNQNFPDPPISTFPAGGQAGFAIKRNGNTLIGPIDGNYQITSLRGPVGN
jgi:hypothetical protein